VRIKPLCELFPDYGNQNRFWLSKEYSAECEQSKYNNHVKLFNGYTNYFAKDFDLVVLFNAIE